MNNTNKESRELKLNLSPIKKGMERNVYFHIAVAGFWVSLTLLAVIYDVIPVYSQKTLAILQEAKSLNEKAKEILKEVQDLTPLYYKRMEVALHTAKDLTKQAKIYRNQWENYNAKLKKLHHILSNK